MAPFLWLQVGTAHWQTAPIPLPAKPTQISKLPKLTQVITISCLVNTACSSLWGFSVTFCPIHIIPTLLPSSPSTRPPILTCPSHPTPQFSLIVPLTLESAKCLLPWLPVQFWLPALSPPAFPRCATCAPESHLCWQLPRRWLFHYRLLKNLAPAFGPVIWGGVCFHPSYFKTDLPNFHFNPGKKKKIICEAPHCQGNCWCTTILLWQENSGDEKKRLLLGFSWRVLGGFTVWTWSGELLWASLFT